MKKFALMLLFGMLFFYAFAFCQEGTEYPPLPTLLLTIAGAVTPMLIQILIKTIKGERARFLASLGLSGVTGAIALAIAGYKISANPELIALWYAWTSSTYKLWWKQLWKNPTSALHASPTK